MKKCLVITIRFLGDRYHGRTENGREPEWPPSPLRLFQAIVAGVAPRWDDVQLRQREAPALEWLQTLGAPRIIAPMAQAGRPVLHYVRENLSDVATDKRDAKFARPTIFLGDPVLRYSWFFEASEQPLAEVVAQCSRHCRALGWGIDMIVGNGQITDTEPEAGANVVWYPEPNWTDIGALLRVPRCPTSEASVGTLAELCNRFRHSLSRIADGRNPVPPLTAYTIVRYRRATGAVHRPFTAFQLLTPDGERRWSRNARQTKEVAGMLRSATAVAAQAVNKPKTWVDTFVLGHGSGKNQQAVGEEGVQRFAYVPLPTIRPQGPVGRVNRVLIVEPPGGTGTDANWARRMLSGRELIEAKTKLPVALLSPTPRADWVVRQYTSGTAGSAVWSTVTPVVLPGYDDPDHLRRRLKDVNTSQAKKRMLERLDARIDGLLRKAIVQAGFSTTLANCAELCWRQVGFRPGLDLATRYTPPDHLRGKPRFHVRIHWKDTIGNPVNVRGPVIIGGGRYYGLGLFATEE